MRKNLYIRWNTMQYLKQVKIYIKHPQWTIMGTEDSHL